MVCSNCKNVIADDSKFCEFCGTAINSQQAQPSSQVSYQQVPPPPAPPQYNPQQGQGYQQRQQYQQNQYQQVYNQNNNSMNAGNPPALTVGQYIVMWLIQLIPFVGVIMLFVWAFSSTENPNRKNYARAILITMLIGLGLSILMFIIMAVVGASIFSDMTNSFSGYEYF